MIKFCTTLGLVLIAPVMAFAAETAAPETAAEERPEHYEAPVFENTDQALEAMKTKFDEINALLNNDDGVTEVELEAIHEKTYTLEHGVDRLRADKAGHETRINALDEAVQALHFASESQNMATTKDWLVKAQDAMASLTEAPVAATKEPEKTAEKKEFYEIVIKDHKFSPEEIRVPAGQKIKLIVDNQDPTPEEFESHDLNREKIIAGNTKATIFVGPLEPGKYHFFGEFNMATAKGDIIAE